MLRDDLFSEGSLFCALHAASHERQRLVTDAGFDPVVVGGLARAKDFDVGTPVYTKLLTAAELRKALGPSGP